jgi:two-component system KDP operon response regulator KdpE
VLVLSDQSDEASKVRALDAGAGDYLVKPFSNGELLARLRVLQRPLPNLPDGPLLVEGELRADLSTHKITLGDRSVNLTPNEEALFFVLARYSGKVVSRAHLVRAVWGVHSDGRVHDLQVLVGQLRKKLEPYGDEVLIKTEGNLGYRLSFTVPANAVMTSTVS